MTSACDVGITHPHGNDNTRKLSDAKGSFISGRPDETSGTTPAASVLCHHAAQGGNGSTSAPQPPICKFQYPSCDFQMTTLMEDATTNAATVLCPRREAPVHECVLLSEEDQRPHSWSNACLSDQMRIQVAKCSTFAS